MYIYQWFVFQKKIDRYFGMTLPDAKTGCEIYEQFVKQSQQIINFLEVGRKIDQTSESEIPRLKTVCTVFGGFFCVSFTLHSNNKEKWCHMDLCMYVYLQRIVLFLIPLGFSLFEYWKEKKIHSTLLFLP